MGLIKHVNEASHISKSKKKKTSHGVALLCGATYGGASHAGATHAGATRCNGLHTPLCGATVFSVLQCVAVCCNGSLTLRHVRYFALWGGYD